MKYIKVANFFLNTEKAEGNRPNWKGKVKFEEAVQADKEYYIAGWDKDGNISCAITRSEDEN